MRLLISISSTQEIGPALRGGAQVLDVKDPALGSLGRASPGVVRAARAAAPAAVPVSAALGDRLPEPGTEELARLADAAARLARSGAGLLKVGLEGIEAGAAVEALAELGERVRAACALRPRVVGVAFGDGIGARCVLPADLPDVARGAGLEGAMLDTLRKGRSLLEVLGEPALERWVASVHEQGLLCGLAGSLAIADVPRAFALGADVVGLRGAVCAGGRSGRVIAVRVRRARAALERAAMAEAAAGAAWS